MKTPNQAFHEVKGILKRVPVVQRLLNLKGGIANKVTRLRELSDLIKENKVIVFPCYAGTGNDTVLTHEMVHEELKEWLDIYGTIRLGRKTAAAIEAPAGAVLLYIPQAMLAIPSTHEEYLAKVGHNARNTIGKAKKHGYEFKEFIWNDHLDEIYEINTSKEERQSLPMLGWYREPVQPRYHSEEELRYRKYYGAFKDGKLYAYFHFWICGDIAIAKHIMGHARHLPYGIMAGLISYAVQECTKNPQTRWIYYGRYEGSSSLDSFKKHTGFQKYAILLDLNCHRELLEHSKRAVKTLWRI